MNSGFRVESRNSRPNGFAQFALTPTSDLNRFHNFCKLFPMTSNYGKIIKDNLTRIYANPPEELEKALLAEREDNVFLFRAFGQDCSLGPEKITMDGTEERGPKGLIVSLYATHINQEKIQLEPFQAFKDFPGSMPYHGAFSANSEQVLVPHVTQIREGQNVIMGAFSGEMGPEGLAGDFSFVLYPLPKIALCYIFYLPDEEFPASVTCLFSHNALSFMPLDGLADVAEYTSKAIIQLLKGTP